MAASAALAVSVCADASAAVTGNRINSVSVGAGGTSAPVPQYWAGDADIFIHSAANTAAVMRREAGLKVQSSSILGNQAEYMLESINRARADLTALERNGNRTNPRAIPAIRSGIAQLNAAEAQARSLTRAARSGRIGPTFAVTSQSAWSHLRGAEKDMWNIASAYPMGAAAGHRSAGSANWGGNGGGGNGGGGR